MKIALNTSLEGLETVLKTLSEIGYIKIPLSFSRDECLAVCRESEAIFTNPNNLGFKYDAKFLLECRHLKYFVTASTGTDHIDLDFLNSLGVKLLCLRDDTTFMKQVTATAEHALCLTLAMARNLPIAFEKVKNGDWSWVGCVGSQISNKTVGVIGYGRLGKLYASFMAPMAKNVLVYDPYLNVSDFTPFKSSHLDTVLGCDILSLHMHSDAQNQNWLDKEKLSLTKEDALIVNTSRGGIVNEHHLAEHLKKNVSARYATDVLANELNDFRTSPLFVKDLARQVMVTPHIGGMTVDSRRLAYTRVVEKFENELKQ